MYIIEKYKLTPISFCILSLLGASLPSLAIESDIVLQKGGENLRELSVTKVENVEEISDLNVLSDADIYAAKRSDLSEAISILPSVRIDNTSSSSIQQGDLQPAEFSIRGAAPYQNNIQLDNSSIDSLLDPASKLNAGDTPNRTQTSGHSQSVFMDTRFISDITVLDMNISAKEGGFSGGVIKASTRSFSGENSLEVSHRLTKDSWTDFHVDDNQLQHFEDGAAQRVTGTPGQFQPDFDKSETSISGETSIGNIGFFVGFSDKRAQISQKKTSALAVQSDMPYFLETGNAFKRGEPSELNTKSQFLTIRADALDTPYDLYTTLSYSNYAQESFLINFLNSDFTNENEGLNLSVNYGNTFSNTRLDSTFSINMSSNERESQSNTLSNYTGRNFYDQQAIIGGFGDLTSEQQSFSADFDFTTPWLETTDINYGVSIKSVQLEQNREQDFVDITFYPNSSTLLNGLQGAVAYEEHHLQREVTYAAGNIDFNANNMAVYAEVDGGLNTLFYRAGARVTRDDWLKNTNIAPRLTIGTFLNDNKSSKIEFGANRYYGKSFLTYRLRDEEKKFVTVKERALPFDPNSDVITTNGEDQWLGNKLVTPYDDEYSLQLTQYDVAGTLALNIVLREGREQIRSVYDNENSTYQYQNIGESSTEQIDLVWRSDYFDWISATWHVNSTLSWMDQQTDAQYLDGGYGNIDNPLDEVMFEGNPTKKIDLPAQDFATPISAHINIVTIALDNALLINNMFSYTNGYQYLNKVGSDEQTGLEIYKIEEQGSTFNWDLALTYQFKSNYGEPYLSIDIVNVLNNDNIIRYENGTQLFSVGRQFWLEIGYQF